MEQLHKLKPLHLYLIGVGIGIIGTRLKNLPAAKYTLLILGLSISVYAIVKYFRGK